MIYKASLDKLAKITSIGVTILYASMAIFLFPVLQHESYWVTAIIIILLIVTYLTCLGYSPRAYQVTEDFLVINRLFYNVKYSRATIEKVEMLNNDQMGFAIRVFGVGGLFGYFGYFASKHQGSMLWYASQRSNYVMIHLVNGKKIVLTPDDYIGFVSALTQ